MFVRGFKCKDIDYEYFENITCKLKAIRGRKGVMILKYFIKKPMEHPYVKS